MVPLWQAGLMSPARPGRPRLRKREIAIAVAAGVVAAGGAALMLDNGGGGGGGPPELAYGGARAMTYQVADFDGISTSGPQDVVVTQGETFAVRSEGSPQALAQLEAVNVDGTLTIRPKNGFNWGNWRSLSGATFYVTLPRLDSVAVAGSGDIRVDRIEAPSFEGTIAGSGELSIAQMQVDEADFKIAGGGNVQAQGTAREARVAIGGSGDVSAAGLRSETASVSIGGSGDVALTVADEAKISIMGSGNVDIDGPGRCQVTRFGSGEVRCDGGGGTDD